MVLWEDIKENGSQEYGLAYDGFFSNVVKSSTIRYVIAVTKKEKKKEGMLQLLYLIYTT